MFPKKQRQSNIRAIERSKEKEKKDYYASKLSKSGKTTEKTCKTTKIQGQYPTNATLIAGDSIISGICEERLSGKNGVVKVCNFAGATIQDIQRNLVPILERNPCFLIFHVGTNNAKSSTSEFSDKLLS